MTKKTAVKNVLSKVPAKVIKAAAKKVGVKKTPMPRVMSVERFNSLPKAEQRVLIAKDVIAQINIGKYKANTGNYIQDLKVSNSILNKDARKHINEIKSCEVCALGGCLISAVKFKNTLTVNQLKDLHDVLNDRISPQGKLITSVFTKKQLQMIETAFEKGFSLWADAINDDNYLTGDVYDKCTEFGYKYDKDKDRLLAIMKNIVTNKGTFKP